MKYLKRILSTRLTEVLLALVTAVWTVPGIWWGLPTGIPDDPIHTWAPDEIGPLGPVAELHSVFLGSSSATFNPQYPLFHYLALSPLIGGYLGILTLTGGFHAPSPAYPFGLVDPARSLHIMTVLCRIGTLVMAMGVVLAAYRTALTVWNRRTGLIAAALVLVCYPFVFYSRTSNVDVPALFWTSLGLLVFAGCRRNGLTPGRAMLLGVFAALATATKDASYAAFAGMGLVLLVHFLTSRSQSPDGRRWLPLVLLPLVTSAAVYAIASGLVFSPTRFRQHVDFIVHGSPRWKGLFYDSTPATVAGYWSVIKASGAALRESLGWPVIASAVAGVALAARERSWSLALIVPAVTIWIGTVLPVRFALLRFLLVPAYVLSLFAASALAAALGSSRLMVRWIGTIAVVLTGAWGATRGVDLVRRMNADSRYEVASWLSQYARPGDRVGHYADARFLPALPPGVRSDPLTGRVPRAGSHGSESPEFIVLVPVYHFEQAHEIFLPPAVYQGLRDGSLDYQLVLAPESVSWFGRRPTLPVDPPVAVFARKDVAARITSRSAAPPARQ